MEQLTFKSLLTQFSFDDILPEFKALYQRNQPKQAQHANWEAYRSVYQKLQIHDVSESQYAIYLVSRWEGCSPMIDMNCSVYNPKDEDSDYYPVASYSPWSALLGMDIHIDEDVTITLQELTAGLLWEITYYGETEEMVQEHLEKLFK